MGGGGTHILGPFCPYPLPANSLGGGGGGLEHPEFILYSNIGLEGTWYNTPGKIHMIDE